MKSNTRQPPCTHCLPLSHTYNSPCSPISQSQPTCRRTDSSPSCDRPSPIKSSSHDTTPKSPRRSKPSCTTIQISLSQTPCATPSRVTVATSNASSSSVRRGILSHPEVVTTPFGSGTSRRVSAAAFSKATSAASGMWHPTNLGPSSQVQVAMRVYGSGTSDNFTRTPRPTPSPHPSHPPTTMTATSRSHASQPSAATSRPAMRAAMPASISAPSAPAV